MSVEEGFWEGRGWHVLGLGKVSEVKISVGDQHATYIMLFLRENLGAPYSRQIAAYLAAVMSDATSAYTGEEGCAPLPVSEKDRDLKGVQAAFEQFLRTLEYRTVLDQSDLQSLGMAKGILPEFYQKAVAAGVTKILMF